MSKNVIWVLAIIALSSTLGASAWGLTVIIPDTSADVGSSIAMPIRVTDFNDVGAVTLKIRYDDTVLGYIGVVSNVDGVDFLASASGGLISIAWVDMSGENPIDFGDGVLLYLNFNVIGDEGSSTSLDFTNQCELANGMGDPIAGVVFNDGTFSVQLPELAPNILLSATGHDFGTVSIGSYADWNLAIYNLGSATLTVNSVTSDNPVFKVISAKFPQDVSPGNSLNITVKFSPTEARSYTGMLKISSNDPDEPEISVSLTGNSIQLVSIDLTVDLSIITSDGYSTFKVVASYSDGSQKDVTSEASYKIITGFKYGKIEGTGLRGTNSTYEDKKVTVEASYGGKTDGEEVIVQGKPVQKVTYTMDTSPSGLPNSIVVDGSVYTSPQTFRWTQGSSYTIQANSLIPDGIGKRYVFTQWNDGNRTNPRIVIVGTNDMTYIAYYKSQYYLTVDSPKGDPQGQGWYDSGSTASWSVTSPVSGGTGIRYTASPSSGSVVMDGPKTVNVSWKTQYHLEAKVYGQGKIELSPSGPWYDSSYTVSIEAMPDRGYSFSGWSGDLSGRHSTVTIVMDGPKSIIANFTKISYPNIVVLLKASSNLVHVGDTLIVAHKTENKGEGVAYNLVIEGGGYKDLFEKVSSFGDWKADRIDPGGRIEGTLTLKAVEPGSATIWVRAWYKDESGMDYESGIDSMKVVVRRLYILRVNVSPLGSGGVRLNPSGGTYSPGTQVTLTAIPASDWVFDHWSGDDSGSSNPITITMTSDKTVTANFALRIIDIDLTVVPRTIAYDGYSSFKVIASYSDGSQKEVTLDASYRIVDGSEYARIEGTGLRGANNTPDDRKVTVEASYRGKTDRKEVTVRGHVNHPPAQPSNILPADGDTTNLTPTLRSSSFYDPDAGDTHVASQWQITTVPGDYSEPIIFDSGRDTLNLTNITIPEEKKLDYPATYYWRVRYQDNHGAWSEWSEETSFKPFPKEVFGYNGKITEIDRNRIEVFARASENCLLQDTTLVVEVTDQTQFHHVWFPQGIVPPGTRIPEEPIEFEDLKVGDDVIVMSSANIKGKIKFEAWRVDVDKSFEGVKVVITIPTDSSCYSTLSSSITVGGRILDCSGSELSKVEVKNITNGSVGVDFSVYGHYDTSFSVDEITLALGINKIVATGHDVAGNIDTDTLTVNFSGIYRDYTFQTADNAMEVKVDTTWHDSPYTCRWEDGTSHTLEVPATEVVSEGCRYKFTGWGGKVTSADTLISIHADSSSAGVYDANYRKQYTLEVETEPASLISHIEVPSPDDPPNWYDDGRELRLTAPEVIDTLKFKYWEVDGNIVTDSSITIKMDKSHNVIVSYSSVEVPEVVLTLSSSADSLCVSDTLSVSYQVKNTGRGTAYDVDVRIGGFVELDKISRSGMWNTDTLTPGHSIGGSITLRAIKQGIARMALTAYYKDELSRDYKVDTTVTIKITLPLPEITLDTKPSGLPIVVDGSSYNSPKVFRWEAGSEHTVQGESPVEEAGKRYVFTGWSDGDTSNPRTIVVGDSDMTYIVSYKTQYYLETKVEGQGRIELSPSGPWYDSRDTVFVKAVPSDSYSFLGWSGDLSGVKEDTTLVMDGPKGIVANFALVPEVGLAVVNSSGSPGGVGEVPICLDNKVEVAGVELMLNYDPDILSLDSVKVTTRTQYMDIFSWNIIESGKAKLLIADMGGDLIDPDSCSIADFLFKVASDASPGDTIYLSLSNVVLSDRSGGKIRVGTMDGIFIIGGVKGDLNGDGMVDVTDLITLINIILGKITPTPSQGWAGDLNSDGSLDVRDVVLLINRILGRAQKAAKVLISSPAVVGMAEDEGVVSISVDAGIPVAGVQLELGYDPGKLAPGRPRLTGRGSGMVLAYDFRDDRLKILVYSPNGMAIPTGKGPVVSIPFKAEDFGRVRLEDIILSDEDGRVIPTDIVDRLLELRIQKAYQLWQNSPNPFNFETSIQYYLPEAGKVTLEVWDILGRRVRRLVDGYRMAGHYTVRWNGQDELGNEVSSGIYIYRIRCGDYTKLRKMLLVR